MRSSSSADPSRKSISYVRLNGTWPEDDAWASMYGHMFIEDVRLHIMPTGGRSPTRPDFSLEVASESTSIRDIVNRAFVSRGHHNSSDVQENLSAFIRETASALAYRGIVHYEVIQGRWPEGTAEFGNGNGQPVTDLKPFRLERIQGQIIGLGPYFVQIIPANDWQYTDGRFALIPGSGVWVVRVPRELGGVRKHRRLLRTLVQASARWPEHVIRAAAGLSEIRGLRFRDFHRQQLLAVASESAEWGWEARSLWHEETLEYFRVHRHLRFALSMAVLRKHIVASMNALLERVGSSAEITLGGLPTPGEIKDCISELEVGEVSFDEALASVRS